MTSAGGLRIAKSMFHIEKTGQCATTLRGTRHHRGVGIPRRGRSHLAASPPLCRDLGERGGVCMSSGAYDWPSLSQPHVHGVPDSEACGTCVMRGTSLAESATSGSAGAAAGLPAQRHHTRQPHSSGGRPPQWPCATDRPPPDQEEPHGATGSGRGRHPSAPPHTPAASSSWSRETPPRALAAARPPVAGVDARAARARRASSRPAPAGGASGPPRRGGGAGACGGAPPRPALPPPTPRPPPSTSAHPRAGSAAACGRTP